MKAARKTYRPRLTKTPHFRASEEENAWLVKQAAEHGGLSLTGYLRQKCLAEYFEAIKAAALAEGSQLVIPQSAARVARPKKPTVDVQTLGRVLGQLGKCGSNLNQIAHKLNADEVVLRPTIAAAVDELRQLAGAIMRTLGRGQDGDSD